MEEYVVLYDKKHWTIERYTENGSPMYKVKYGFDNELKAQQRCFELNLRPDTIHKMVAYKCPICNKWHIGHNNTLLEDKDKEKIKKQYNEWKIIHKMK